ncbi:MAG: hypothetical protein NW203_15210 [Hyphomonadaceae bacterium]|nr:hypothetical protein [Hyphomonadaceae bacterium]
MRACDLRHHAHSAADMRIDLLALPALSEADVAQIFAQFSGRQIPGRTLDGDRSVILPAQGDTLHGGVKIKGAGFRGGRVRMDRRHDKPYPLPRYDAEGAATIDAAKDHGRALGGAMSYQQARHEVAVARHLAAAGVRVFPALGYGAVRREGGVSWFCALDWPRDGAPDWWTLTRDRDGALRAAHALGETQRELARHDVYLVLSGLVAHHNAFIRKDFHTAHIAGPNDSPLALLSYFLFDMNFILAQFVHDRHMPDIADHRARAKEAYVHALTGNAFSVDVIDRFKTLLVELKYADWEMDRRIARLAADPIGGTLLQAFIAESGEAALYGDLPAPETPAAPSPQPQRRRLSWLRWLR